MQYVGIFEKACLSVLDARHFFAGHRMAPDEVDARQVCLGPLHHGCLGTAGVRDYTPGD